jgi:hypothetical protein
MQVNLTEDQSWRGVLYPAGDREVPDELAIALGLMALPTVPAAPPSEVTVTSGDDLAADFAKVQQPSKPTRRKGA